MPFINVKTNTAVTKEQELSLKAKLGEAITTIPGKSESWLMAGIEPDYILYFQGKDDPCAMVDVDLLGTASPAHLNALTGAVTKVIAETLSIPAPRIYVKFTQRSEWGWNGANL